MVMVTMYFVRVPRQVEVSLASFPGWFETPKSQVTSGSRSLHLVTSTFCKVKVYQGDPKKRGLKFKPPSITAHLSWLVKAIRKVRSFYLALG